MTTMDQHLPLAIRRAAELVPTAWKNGNGTTCEVAVSPDDASFNDFTWRASMAEIATDGDFSPFPGIDRTLVLLGGAGVVLHLDTGRGPAEQHTLYEPFEPFRFAGETPLRATLLQGASHGFNLMIRRNAGAGDVEVWRGPGNFVLPEDLVLLFIVRGVVELHGAGANAPAPIALDPCDSVKVNALAKSGLSVVLPANAVVLAVRIRLTAD